MKTTSERTRNLRIHLSQDHRAVWFSIIPPGSLDLVSPVTINAVFSVTAMAVNLSYIIPVFCRRVYHINSHPDVMFKFGPFYMGNGWMGLLCKLFASSQNTN